MMQEVARVMDREMKGKIDNISQVVVSLSFQQFFAGKELQADGISYKRKLTPPSVDDMRLMIWFLKKCQLCYGGILTMLLPECHANQATWSEVDKDLFDRVRQIMLELVRSFGCQATKALSLSSQIKHQNRINLLCFLRINQNRINLCVFPN